MIELLLIVVLSLRKVIELCGRTAGSGSREARHARDPKNPDVYVRFDRGSGAPPGPSRTCALSTCDLVTWWLHSVNYGLA